MTVKKAPVVMFHGAFTGPWVWGGFAEKFKSADYKVHTPCLRHHENKKPSAGLAQVSLTDYAADLGSFLDELGTPAILVGHSMGGFLAQMVAAKKKFSPCVAGAIRALGRAAFHPVRNRQRPGHAAEWGVLGHGAETR